MNIRRLINSRMPGGNSKEIAHKSLVALFIRVLGYIVNYLFLFQVTNIFGASGWGSFALCYSIMQASSLLTTMGIPLAFVKYYAQEGINHRHLYFMSLKPVLAFSLLISIIIYFCAGYFSQIFTDSPDMEYSFQLMALGIIPLAVMLLNAGVFRGMRKIGQYSFYDSFGRFLFGSILVGLLGFFHRTAETPIMGFVLGCITLCILSSIQIAKYLQKDTSGNNINKVDAKDLYSFSISLFWGDFANKGYQWVTTVILGLFLSNYEIGIYDGCFRLASATLMFAFAINSISAPKFASAIQSNEIENITSNIRVSSRLLFWTSVPATLGIAILGPFLLQMLGTDFEGAYIPLLIILVGQLVNNLLGVSTPFMQMTGLHKHYRNIIFITIFSGTILQLILIPTMGLVGAAIVTALVLITKSIGAAIYIYYKRSINVLYIPFITK